MTSMPMPDPYREGDTPFFLDDSPYDEFEAFRHYWRGGATLDELYPDGPFALREPVGPYKANRRGDVAKVQTLLHDTGHLDANETDGPTGIYSRDLLDAPIRRFQAGHDLKVDGVLNPGGETIGKLQSLLGPHTGRDPFEALADDPDAAAPPSVAKAKGTQVADESAAFARHAAGLGLAMGAANEWRRKMEELGRRRSAEPESSGPPPFPAEPPFAPGEMQLPGYPAKPPFDPEEFGKETKPAEPIIVRGTVFPAIPHNKPTVLIFPDLSGEIEQAIIFENRKGNPLTKAELDAIRDRLLVLNPGWKHIAGGRNADSGKEIEEYYIPNPAKDFDGDGRKGSMYMDLTFKGPNGEIVHVQTVDIDKNGKPSQREIDVAERVVKRMRHQIILIPKLWQMKK